MSWLFPRIYDRLVAATEEACFRDWRRDLLAGLSGDVVEIGAGTGANLAHYPATVRRLVVTEPDQGMLDRLGPVLHRVAEGIDVELRRAPADALPLADDSVDAVVCTLVLCSVADPAAALGEARRVLRPGGRLVFLEHVAADGRPERLKWQMRLDTVWPHLAGGCHLTRRSAEAIRAAGFTLGDVRRESARKAAPVIRPTVRGEATLAR